MSAARTRWPLAALVLAGACAHAPALDDTGTIAIPGGSFTMGSSPEDRGRAVELALRSGTYDRHVHDRLADELSLREVEVPAFSIMTVPVTNADYLAYVADTGAPEPYVDADTWDAMRTGYAYARVFPALWQGGEPRPQRREHPVVLVAHEEARAYCAWWGHRRNGRGRLPTEAEWEKAARGTDGRAFPWGDRFDASLAPSAESRRDATAAVGAHAAAASPYGVLDMAGNVFEWTSTAFTRETWVVKGGAFNADAVAARSAARHGRAGGQRHLAIGFRCVLEPGLP